MKQKMKMRKRLRWMAQDLMDRVLGRPARPKQSGLQIVGYYDQDQLHSFPFKMSEQEVIENDE